MILLKDNKKIYFHPAKRTDFFFRFKKETQHNPKLYQHNFTSMRLHCQLQIAYSVKKIIQVKFFIMLGHEFESDWLIDY